MEAPKRSAHMCAVMYKCISTIEVFALLVLIICPLFGSESTMASAASSFSPVRPPATPLIVRGPYVNTWMLADSCAGTWPTFWNQATTAISGVVRIDNVPYIFLGAPGISGNVATMTQINLQITSTQSIYTFQAGGILLTLTFLSPVEPSSVQLQSIPLSYIFAQVQSTTGKNHSVSLYFDISGEWASGDNTDQVNWSRTSVPHNGGTLTSLSFSLVSPKPLTESNEYASWGYPVWATANTPQLTTRIGQDSVVRAQAASTGVLDNSIETGPRAISDRWPVAGFNFALGSVGSNAATVQLVLGHVRSPAVSYLGQNLPSLWQTYWSTSDLMLAFFYDDAAAALARANQLDNRVASVANSVGGANYAAILALSVRQAFGGMEFVKSPNNTPWLTVKEISSGGAFSTVDVIYPAYPILLFLNPEWIKYLMDPVLTYTESGKWPELFCVHDIGRYPIGFAHNDGGGENMPVEETANMLIMAASYLRFADTTAGRNFAQAHYRILKQWADYLNAPNNGTPNRSNALDPLLQNQSDDFTGFIAHSTNLALKGIIAIGAMGLIAQSVGNAADQSFYHNASVTLISQWAQLGQDPAGSHLMISYTESDTTNTTGAGTFSLKYNAFPDKLLGLNLIPASVISKEVAWYKSHANLYGVPLDSRAAYVKVDWALWMLAGMGDAALKQSFLTGIYNFINTTPDRAPFTDLYDTVTGHQSRPPLGFVARPVVGGLFTLINLSQLQ